jgi:hypothetical protein
LARQYGWPIDEVTLRNRIVSEVPYGWMRIDELALALDVDLKSLVPVLKVLRLDEHIEADGGPCAPSPRHGRWSWRRAEQRSDAGDDREPGPEEVSGVSGVYPPSSAVSP